VSRLLVSLICTDFFNWCINFLNSYNSSDPFQKIEKWDPNWVDDQDDEPYCSWCDDYGHDISDCESVGGASTVSNTMITTKTAALMRPKEEEEDADAELAEDTATAG
jgi:hypothetical protein